LNLRFAVTIRLPQVIDNLLSNALKCTKEGTLTVFISRRQWCEAHYREYKGQSSGHRS